MTQPKPKEDWMEEFERLFPEGEFVTHAIHTKSYTGEKDALGSQRHNKIKYYISKLLKAQEERIVEDVDYWFSELLNQPLGDFERNKIRETRENIIKSIKQETKG